MRMQLSTGLEGLDRVLRGLMPGDNLVWQVDSIRDYEPFVEPYVRYACENRQKLIYFRFADHEPLVKPERGVLIRELEPEKGFDPFLQGVHSTINEAGRGNLYLFDCLSELAPDWCSDRMLGNFFMLTCPYLYDRAAIAYFAVLRHRHSFHAVRPITNTTQILIDVYRHEEKLYIHPLKVQHRHSNTMYMLHVWEGDEFLPVKQSGIITELLKAVPWSRQDAASLQLGYWSKTFADAEAIQVNLENGVDCQAVADDYFRRILRMLISTDDAVLRLADEYLTLKDLLKIRRRMIGTGLLGGKSVGMLIARAILRKRDRRWDGILEMHDSFYVGADVFYTYLVQNGCWWMMQKHKTTHALDDDTETARRRILAGEFPEYIVAQFSDMLDYFGQSPIIVRSSSLLEDNFGNAFAGKYESVFCANQGGPHKRLEDFLSAVRMVYASTMSEEALQYRYNRGLLGQNEQMALLIQRVSGATYGNLFFPQAAGVGFSFNPWVWHETIDPKAGVLRLVFGVGTRAVDRADDDYTRLVALNAPQRRPETSFDEVRQYAQRRVDVLDLEANQLTSARFEAILEKCHALLPVDMFAADDRNLARRARTGDRPVRPSFASRVLTFDRLLKETPFVEDMRLLLQTLQEAYDYPVDVEFTLNFFDGKTYRINLLQCRPLQVRDVDPVATPPEPLAEEDLVLVSRGAVVGKSALIDVAWFVYVVPASYGKLPIGDRYDVARLIHDITHHKDVAGGPIMLLGPGRWGTQSPALGIPVTFADIEHVSVLCEIVTMREDLVPDVSLGTHFLNELVEMDMLYLAFFPKQSENYLSRRFFEESPNELLRLLPGAQKWESIVRAVRSADTIPAGASVRLNANALEQKVVCYVDSRAKGGGRSAR
ncbi:MAG: PEP/pyruvate-binding domain-containing protein [Kiritimatiellae bacterium]|nr:PEP/pyruvate-binding domain-containing protein [Kiritimatiellia bacterium]